MLSTLPVQTKVCASFSTKYTAKCAREILVCEAIYISMM